MTSHLTYFMTNIIKIHIVVLQSLSHVQFFVTPWTEYTRLACPSLSTGIAQNHVYRESVMLSNDLILCCHLLLLPSIFPSNRVFSNVSALHVKWPKYWSFHFSISPSSQYSGLISFRMDWFDPLAVQGTLKSLLRDSQESSPTPQFKSISSSVLSLLYGPSLTSLHDYW